MCFNEYWSGGTQDALPAAQAPPHVSSNAPSGFSVLGLFIAWYVHEKMPSMKGTRAAEGVLFFFAMEFLQFFQYFWIADNLQDEKCKNIINKALTFAGFLHICLQVFSLPLLPIYFSILCLFSLTTRT